jgi:hypothetical protein
MPANMPKDDDRTSMPLTPARIALSQVVNASISSSATLNITAGATILRCYSADKDTYLKWGSTTVTSSNFDEILPANQIVDLVVPQDSSGVLYTTTRVIERAATATLIVIQK